MNRTVHSLVLASSIALSSVGSILAEEARADEAMNAHVSDARRETQILTSFSMNPHLHAYDLTVIVDGNKAVLNGTVEDAIGRELAERIATDVDGIKFVENRIVVNTAYTRVRQVSERGFGEKVEDATISATIKSKLLWNSATDGLDIHVDTNNGKVVLSGVARSTGEKETAGRIAKFTNGVVALNNDIVVGSPAGSSDKTEANEKAEQTVSDTWITSKVKSSLMFTRGVDGLQITVTTTNGVVSLNGLVDSTAERELAVRVARDVRGVKKVDADGLKVG